MFLWSLLSGMVIHSNITCKKLMIIILYTQIQNFNSNVFIKRLNNKNNITN